MATPKSSFHIRSISLPSKSHPLDASIKDNLRRLSASQAGPSNSSSVCQNLCGIKDLYEQMNEMICLPHNQILLSQNLHRRDVELVLDGSLVMLDLSSSALDALSQMKESVLDLQSALRRGSHSQGIHSYLMSRKMISKAVSKCLAYLKKVEMSCTLAQPENDVRMLKEAEVISLSTLKSVLLYLMGKKAMSQTGGWSLVSKLVKSKNSSHDVANATEVEEIDHVLCSPSTKQFNAELTVILKHLEQLELIIHELEDGLESISRCLVKTRVSLLNLLNP